MEGHQYLRIRGHFNPRPPRGGRPACFAAGFASVGFQSTPPARGATMMANQYIDANDISIHAPREGGDIGVT